MPLELDARGLKCPLPVLRARKTLKSLDPGEILVVYATDPAAPRDFEAFCEQTDNELVSCEEAGEDFRITVKRAG